MKRATVRVTRNFARNLDAIEAFLREADAAAAFSPLLDDLFGQAIPALEQFHDLGTDFCRNRPSSRETAGSWGLNSVQIRLGSRLRPLCVRAAIIGSNFAAHLTSTPSRCPLCRSPDE